MMRRRPLLAAAALAVVALAGCATPDAPTFAAQDDPPPLAAQPAGPGYVDRVDPQWAQRTAESTGIPLRALTAYAGAVIRSAEVYPECGIGWNTLAALGLVESDHGRHDG